MRRYSVQVHRTDLHLNKRHHIFSLYDFIPEYVGNVMMIIIFRPCVDKNDCPV